MGLIILFAVEKFDIPLSENDLVLLCTLLCSNASSPADLDSDLSHIFGTCQRYRVCVSNDFTAVYDMILKVSTCHRLDADELEVTAARDVTHRPRRRLPLQPFSELMFVFTFITLLPNSLLLRSFVVYHAWPLMTQNEQ